MSAEATTEMLGPVDARDGGVCTSCGRPCLPHASHACRTCRSAARNAAGVPLGFDREACVRAYKTEPGTTGKPIRVRDLAKRYGVRASVVHETLKAAGVLRASGSSRTFDHDEILRLVASGLTDNETARRVGCTSHNVRAVRRGNGVAVNARPAPTVEELCRGRAQRLAAEITGGADFTRRDIERRYSIGATEASLVMTDMQAIGVRVVLEHRPSGGALRVVMRGRDSAARPSDESDVLRCLRSIEERLARLETARAVTT
jgi:hypothetical protein